MTTKEQQEFIGNLNDSEREQREHEEEQDNQDRYIKIIETANKQLHYDIDCLDDESILIFSRMIYGYREKYFP